MTYQINGHKIEFDPFDLDSMEAYRNGCDAVAEEYARPVEGEDAIARLRRMCDATLAFFEDCVGEEKARAAFGERLNVRDLVGAFRSFTDAVNADIAKLTADLTKPAGNRAQRRAAERKK